MFRRKEEDSLFDNPNQDSSESAAQAPGSANASGAYNNPPVPPQSRFPSSESRPASAPSSGNSFRPSATPASDLPRNRLPDTKPVSGVSSVSGGIVTDKSGKTVRRVLTVGSDILLKGEIATCDRLVIEGKVDATLNDVHTVEIAETGSFKGSAHIEDAEISGLFEGDLVVRGRLVIYSTGKVRGKITYGEIEIERGGELSGEIKSGNAQGASARPVRSVKEEKVAA